MLCLADAGYQGLADLHNNSQTPPKKSKHHPLTVDQKAANRELARQSIYVEHAIRRVKVFRILSERYHNRRKRFGLRYNLIASLYNLELKWLLQEVLYNHDYDPVNVQYVLKNNIIRMLFLYWVRSAVSRK